MKLQVEQHQINKSHPLYKTIDNFCFYSKNLYNCANYIIRQEFISSYKSTGIGNWIKYKKLDKMLQSTPEYKQLMSQASQCTLQVLDRNWKSFFSALGKYNKNPSGFLNRPQIPKYKKPNGRNTWFLKNNQTYIKDGKLYFRLKAMNNFGFKTSVTNRLVSVRFIPRGNIYVLEIIYEVPEVTPKEDNGKVLGIDMGVNNFLTITNNIGLQPIIINGKGIKSINQFYNKQKAILQSDLRKRNGKNNSKRINSLNLKRHNRIKNFMHHSSKYVINYCIENEINTIVIGKNDTWKQNSNMGNSNNQKFLYIPYEMLIEQLEYKGYNVGINIIQTEERYTSGTSFLDGETPTKENYNKGRRIQRGLFKSNEGKVINSDVNGSLQIIKKVFPNTFESNGIKGSLVPIVINVVNFTI